MKTSEDEHGSHDQPGGHDDRHGGSGAEHDHDHPRGLRGFVTQLIQPHSHDAADSIDDALGGSADGIRAVKLSLLGLGVTAGLQLIVVLISGSVALLADTIHNFGDALTAIPLWLAFSYSRRPANRRYSYGYGRAEDLAGVFVVLMIAGSAALAAFVAIRRLLDPQPVSDLWWVAAASIVGFAGNEMVAQYRIRSGKRIGSAALVADGYHARTDGLTSLAVLLGVFGAWLGFKQADPIVGLIITGAILLVVKGAVVQIWHRLMDAVDPELLDAARAAAQGVAGVTEVSLVRPRWVSHTIHAEAQVTVDRELSLAEAHTISAQVEHAMMHAVPKLSSVIVHVDPCDHAGDDPHAVVSHHRNQPQTSAKRRSEDRTS